MAVQGAIADAARGYLPVTWDALSRDAERFGDGLLSAKVELVMETVLGQIIPPADEDLLPLRAIHYMGKLVALEIIPAGIDFWMNEVTSESAQGPNENHTWVDRADKLRQLAETLGWQVRKDETAILALLGRKPALKTLPRMGISVSADDVLLTPNPREFPAQFKQGTGTQRLT